MFRNRFVDLSVLFACCIFATRLSHGVVSAADKDESCTTTNKVRLEDLRQTCNLDYIIARVGLCNGSVIKPTVCDDQWTVQDAMVACKEAGYRAEGAVALYLNQRSTEGSIAKVVPQCDGSESNVSQCSVTLRSSNVSCTQNNNNTIAVVACPRSENVPEFNISSCGTLTPLQIASVDYELPTVDSITTPGIDSSTTKQDATASTPSSVDGTSTPPKDSPTDTEQTMSEGATDAASNGLNLTIIYAAAGAAGGVIILIVIVAFLLIVIAARRRKISPDSPRRGHNQNNNSNEVKEIGTGSVGGMDSISSGPVKHTIELDQPIYEQLKESKGEGSPSMSVKSGADMPSPLYSQLESEQQYAQIEPCISSPVPLDTKPTDSHYQQLNHSMSLTRNTPSNYQPQFTNKTAMAIETGLTTEADVRTPDSTNSQNSTPERFKRALDHHQPPAALDASVNHSVEDLESQVSTSAVVNQRVVPESVASGGAGNLYAVLEAPSPQLTPRTSHSLPRSAPSKKNHDSRSNSMSRLKSGNNSPKNLRLAAKNSSPKSPPKSSGNHGSPKFNRGTHSPYTQRASLNTSRSSGLSSNTSGSGSTEAFVNSSHQGDDGRRMDTLV